MHQGKPPVTQSTYIARWTRDLITPQQQKNKLFKKPPEKTGDTIIAWGYLLKSCRNG